MADKAVIDVQDFCKAYENELAVDGLSFRVGSGQVFGLVGPNGAGKTTTLRALTGIIPISSGSMKVNDSDVDLRPLDVKRQTAYVPDDPQLFNDLTVHEHFAFLRPVFTGLKTGPNEWKTGSHDSICSKR